MKKFILSVFIFISASLFAQSNVYVGGSFTHSGDLPRTFQAAVAAAQANNIAGVDAGFSAKLTGPIGLTFDGNFSRSTVDNQFLFLAGPEFSIRPKQSRIFAHALVGGAYDTQKLKGFKATALADSSFAYAVGGGYEKYLGKVVGLRGAVDYIYTDAFHASENNVRATAGLVFRF